MKVLAILFLTAIVAYASAADEKPTPTTSAATQEYIGPLQEVAGGEIIAIGEYSEEEITDSSDALGIPSCKLGQTIGNPICLAKCISRGHKGGYCVGKVCTCVG